MIQISILRTVFNFFYDTIIGKEVSFKDAILKHTKLIVLTSLLSLSVMFNVIQFKNILEIRGIAKENRSKQMELLTENEELKIALADSIMMYDRIYHIHYDGLGRLILHDPITGENDGSIIPSEHMKAPNDHLNKLLEVNKLLSTNKNN